MGVKESCNEIVIINVFFINCCCSNIYCSCLYGIIIISWFFYFK